MYSIVIERPVAGEYNLRDEIDKACKKVVEMGFADPATDLLTVTAGTVCIICTPHEYIFLKRPLL